MKFRKDLEFQRFPFWMWIFILLVVGKCFCLHYQLH